MSDMSIAKIVESYKRFSNYGMSLDEAKKMVAAFTASSLHGNDPIVQQALDCTSYAVNWNQLSNDKERAVVSNLAAEYGYRCERVADLYLMNGKSIWKTRRAIEKERKAYSV